MRFPIDRTGVARSAARFQASGTLVSGLGTFGLIGFVLLLTRVGSESMPDLEKASKSSCRGVLRFQENPIFSLSWSPDGKKIAASTFGPTVKVWNLDEGGSTTCEGGSEQPRFVMGWSEDSQELVVGGLDIPVESWRIIGGLENGDQEVSRLASRAGELQALARFSRGKSIRVWGSMDIRLSILPESGQSANSIALSPDGRFVASGGADGVLRIFDLATREPFLARPVNEQGITGVAFSPDGKKVATAGGGPVKVWDLVSGKEICRFGKDRNGAANVAFSADGDRIAAADWGGSIQVWDLNSTSRPIQFRGHSGQVLTLAWSPDGKRLASGGYDSTVRLWDVARKVEIAHNDR